MTRPAGVYPLGTVRAVALHAQGLCEPLPRSGRPGADDVNAAIERVGWVQIDTLQVVRRAQYLTLWSRLGSYDPADLDRLLFDGGRTGPDNGRRLFEYWMHAACIIPLTRYPLVMPMMRERAEGRTGWHRRWARDPDRARLLRTVLARIESDGPCRPADIRSEKKRPGTWWNWDDAKIALEHLYDTGALAICNRVNFQRVYDLRDRVLPASVDRREPSVEEATRALLEISLRALGDLRCRPGRRLLSPAPDRVEAVHRRAAGRGALRAGNGPAGRRRQPRAGSPPRQPAASGTGGGRHAATSPHHLPESVRQPVLGQGPGPGLLGGSARCWSATSPTPAREWGYFCLPILHRDRLVGRFDPKLA